MTDVLGQTTFGSLWGNWKFRLSILTELSARYQAGDQIYKLFDKVLILDQGRQVYLGPPSEARQYFVELGYKDLPRQSTADYLTGCSMWQILILCAHDLHLCKADPYERQFADGLSEDDVPHSPVGLEKAFQASKMYKGLIVDTAQLKSSFEIDKIDQEAFRQSVIDDKRKGVSKKSPYTLRYTGQVLVLTQRQFQLRLQDRFSLWTSYVFTTILAFVIGATYFDLPTTAAGGFTRGSLIFVAMLTSALEAFAELPVAMLGRPILNKQTGFTFYRPSAIAWANLFADLPFTALREFIFEFIVFL
jgi:ATP-binding cassette, subfamily G (WHITE), member 2, SNQ2